MSDLTGKNRLETVLENKLRTSFMCVFLSDTVNTCRYMLPNAEVRTVSFEEDAPLYPPCGINLQIKGQKNLLKELFKYIAENTDYENIGTKNISVSVIAPEWGDWKSKEIKRHTASAFAEAVKEIKNSSAPSPVKNYKFFISVLNRGHFIRSVSDYSDFDVIAELNDKFYRFYPSEDSGLAQIGKKAVDDRLRADILYYLEQSLNIFVIAANAKIRKQINGIIAITPSVGITVNNLSDVEKKLFDNRRTISEEKISSDIKLDLNSFILCENEGDETDSNPSLTAIAVKCEKSFRNFLLEKPDGWADGLDITKQSFFTVFFDKVYYETVSKLNKEHNSDFLSSFSAKFQNPLSKSNILKQLSERAKAVEPELIKEISAVADTVYSDNVILQAMNCVNDAVNKIFEKYAQNYQANDLPEINCSPVRENLKTALNDLFCDIAFVRKTESFKLGKENNEYFSKKDLENWFKSGRSDSANIHESFANYLEAAYTGTFSVFSDVIIGEYLKIFEGGKLYEQNC